MRYSKCQSKLVKIVTRLSLNWLRCIPNVLLMYGSIYLSTITVRNILSPVWGTNVEAEFQLITESTNMAEKLPAYGSKSFPVPSLEV
jgi:hypothetical protein